MRAERAVLLSFSSWSWAYLSAPTALPSVSCDIRGPGSPTARPRPAQAVTTTLRTCQPPGGFMRLPFSPTLERQAKPTLGRMSLRPCFLPKSPYLIQIHTHRPGITALPRRILIKTSNSEGLAGARQSWPGPGTQCYSWPGRPGGSPRNRSSQEQIQSNKQALSSSFEANVQAGTWPHRRRAREAGRAGA